MADDQLGDYLEHYYGRTDTGAGPNNLLLALMGNPSTADMRQPSPPQPYTPFPESGTELPRGDARMPAVLSAYQPSWRDQLAAPITGDDRNPFRRLLAMRLLGSSGLGPSADPNEPWRALPVAAPAIDAAEAAYNDQHLPFAAKALDTGLEAWGVGSLPGLLRTLAVKPPLPRGEAFNLPIMRGGKPAGDVYGSVSGDTAHVEGAFLNRYAGNPANSIGPREMRRVFDDLREQYPNTARVTAYRISGARHGKAADKAAEPTAMERFKDVFYEPGNVVDNALVKADNVSKGRLGESALGSESALGDSIYNKMARARDRNNPSNLDFEITPLWEQILNQYGRRGVQ